MACGDTSQNKTTDEPPVVEESNKGTEETNKENLQEDITFEGSKPNEQVDITESSGKRVLVYANYDIIYIY